MREFTIVLEPDSESGFTVSVPALGGCLMQGDDEADAIAMTQEAITVYCESLKESGEDVPDDVQEEPDLSDYAEGSFTRKVQVDV